MSSGYVGLGLLYDSGFGGYGRRPRLLEAWNFGTAHLLDLNFFWNTFIIFRQIMTSPSLFTVKENQSSRRLRSSLSIPSVTSFG